MISEQDWEHLTARLKLRGFLDGDVSWSEACEPPTTAYDFAAEIIFVICNSGMKNTVARRIYDRVIEALAKGQPTSTAFGHPGKAAAIDRIWSERDALFAAYSAISDDDARVEWLGTLPWIGGITKYHAAKNFGVDCVKPDVHLQRLAAHHGVTPTALCQALATMTGLKVRTVDVVLWRACAEGIINSRTGVIA